MDTPQKQSRLTKSPALIFLIVAVSVFVSEASVMLLLYFLPRESLIDEAILDASLLVALISPSLYFFLFRPLVIQIRERKRIEDMLRKNEEEQFKVMIRTSLDAFLIMDMQGRILEVNDAYCNMLGYSRAELIGMNIADVEAAETEDGVVRHIGTLMQKGSDRFESRLRRKDGQIQIVEESSNYSDLHGGRVYCFLRDITERKQVEAHRAQLLQELGSANEELNNFAYVVSHDLKAPLRGISSLADWLSTDYADKFDEDGKEQMRLLINRVHRMDGLIDGILLYSRVGRVKETMTAVDIGRLVPEVIDLLAPPANIAVTIEDPLPTVMAEPTRIQQLFQNLLSNAIKYMDKPEGRIRINCCAEGKQWKFSVSDNGPGIKQQHFEKIFQLFQTLAPRDRVESSGVGLALVKKIVEMYGGTIWVESVVGEGSTFFFTLPRKPAPPNQDKGEKT
ncbi:sensor histidine kinase [Sideroxydans lithotrophicus]|uniref:histidine kinase n=1 Tax=Sideroxydans lithotrophicus (strain ES-1) TaxID=580332 RepID=D5CPQ8_SIDLE|nr:PAS domain-containing sensor histidine kinase [Sideroxydans lithotrophicus]ADE13053.1 multi-sensor signal transduction histidine kinase [Sideroxydans lithotrophicus ES-1]